MFDVELAFISWPNKKYYIDHCVLTFSDLVEIHLRKKFLSFFSKEILKVLNFGPPKWLAVMKTTRLCHSIFYKYDEVKILKKWLLANSKGLPQNYII